MKTFLFVTALCLFPFQSLTAEDISINGQTYRLETIQPVHLDSFGRVVPMPPMTVLVPVRTIRIERLPIPRTTRSFSSRVAQNRSSQTTTQPRLARTDSSTPDVARPVFKQRLTKGLSSHSSQVPAGNSQQRLASTTNRSQSSMLLDSRIPQRRVF